MEGEEQFVVGAERNFDLRKKNRKSVGEKEKEKLEDLWD